MNPLSEPSPSADAQAEFDPFAESYDEVLNRSLAVSGESKEYFARGRIEWLGRVLDRLSFEPASVLDFGCGTGTSLPLLLERFSACSVTGVDVSSASLEVARRNHAGPSVHLFHRDDFQPSGDVDLAFCNGVFHHVPLDERDEAVQYVHRSLRPGGLFAMWENNAWNPGTRYCMWVNDFDQNAIPLSPRAGRRLLRRGGFEIEAINFLFIFPKALAWLRGIEPCVCRLPLGAQYLVLGRKSD